MQRKRAGQKRIYVSLDEIDMIRSGLVSHLLYNVELTSDEKDKYRKLEDRLISLSERKNNNGSQAVH